LAVRYTCLEHGNERERAKELLELATHTPRAVQALKNNPSRIASRLCVIEGRRSDPDVPEEYDDGNGRSGEAHGENLLVTFVQRPFNGGSEPAAYPADMLVENRSSRRLWEVGISANWGCEARPLKVE